MPRGHASQAGRGGSDGSGIPASLNRLLAYALPEMNVSIVEILEKLGEERIAVGGDGFLDTLEQAGVDAFGIVSGFQ